MGVAPMHVYANSYKRGYQVSVIWQYFGLEADEKNIPKQELEDQPVCTKC